MLVGPAIRRLGLKTHSYSRPGDWKPWRMTVCIAALCEERKTLVLVSDKKISFGTFSGENMALKNTPIYGAWIGMYSGNDVSHAVPVRSKARELMKAYHDKFGTLDAPTVANIVHEAYW
jgi:hypothetical protein